jgi:Fe-S-cluster-containing dehydrogenase component
MAACPYGMRHINPLIGIVQKCDFCLHRIEHNNQPACVMSCPTKALVFGDLNDKRSEIYRFVTENNVNVLKEDTGNHPQAFYSGLDFTIADKKGMPE